MKGKVVKDRETSRFTAGLLFIGGAGGKGTWGAIGEVLSEEDLKVRDQHDPNYESEEDEDVSIYMYQHMLVCKFL